MAEDDVPPLTFNAWLRWDVVRRSGVPLRGVSILEIGCGAGALGARLARGAEYVGCEPDPVSHARAVERIGAHGTVYLRELPPPEHRDFDVVCAFEVLEHIDDDGAAVRSWADRLRPGGTLLLSVPADPDRFGAADRAVGHYRRYTRERLEERLAAAGLVDPALRRYGFPLGYALEAGRNVLMARRGRDGGGDRADRTAGSGRLFQPPAALGWAVRLATWPFRVVQRPFERGRLGTGFVAWARRPE